MYSVEDHISKILKWTHNYYFSLGRLGSIKGALSLSFGDPHFILVYSIETEKTWFVEKSCANPSGAPLRNCNQFPISKQLALMLFSNLMCGSLICRFT